MNNLVQIGYLAAGVLFILSLGGLSTQESAKRGNFYGVLGMAIAMVTTFYQSGTSGLGYALAAILGGAVIGSVMAKRVAMTSMPQLVAILHSFVGLAAVLVGYAMYLDPTHEAANPALERGEIYLDIALGALTFTGSVVAWAKLDGRVSGKPWLIPGRHFVNLAILIVIFALGAHVVGSEGTTGLTAMIVMTAAASFLGVHLVAAIGGADMPVVVSLLNSYSGWTAAAAGFMLANDLLIITGALVGSSGAILSYIMCKAMNRSIWNVVFGGFGATPPPKTGEAAKIEGEIQPIEIDELSGLTQGSGSIIVVPGYGLAVAQAQHLVQELSSKLKGSGKEVRFAIHPVAGRLPGHMNVLLAEAGVPYDVVLDMEEINEDFPETDLALVIGANDIANPSAETDESSPIFGMPVLQVWNAKNVVVFKRGMSAGYAGVDNPLFFNKNTRMCFGDAKESLSKLVASLIRG